MSLIEIRAETHAVRLDIAYASGQNVTGKPIYARPGCYLHGDAADRLQRAVDLARPLGFTLKIFDAFRPSEAQGSSGNSGPTPSSSPIPAGARRTPAASRWI